MISSIANSLGYGSGLDVAKLVSDLAAASRDPKVARFDNRSRAVQASISAVAQARSDLESFSTSLASLIAGGTLQSQPSVSDSSIVEAQGRVGARFNGFSGEIEVTQLARAQLLVSASLPSATAAIGEGTLTLTVGTNAVQLTIDSSNSSLAGIADTINAARTGVTASVVTDANGSRLMLKGATGTASAFTVSSSDPGLSSLGYPGGMTLVQAAQNAEFKVDGLSYSRGSNTVEDVIAGVKLTLKKVAPGVPVTLGVTSSEALLKSTLGDFVSVFNTLKGHIADARTATRGDNAMRQLDRQLSQLIGQSVTTGTPSSLSAIGVRTNRDGTIAFDERLFDAAYAKDPGAVEAIFSPTRDATHTPATDPGIGGALAALKTAATASDGVLSSLSTRLGKEASAIADDRARMEAREESNRAKLEKQFGGLDSRVGALKATQSYLDQQIKIWTASR